MEQIVIDSDIFIDFIRAQKDSLLNLFDLQKQQEAELFVSSVTIFELFSGQSSLVQENYLLELFTKVRIVPLDETIAQHAGEINRDNKLNLGLGDLLIAATSIFLKAKLATKNRKHFQQVPGLKFFDYSASSQP